MKIAIFYNKKTNPQNKKYALEVAVVLEKHQLKYFFNPELSDIKRIDLAIAVGGDGTVLYVANLLADLKIPILGINFGHRGYLCSIQKDEIVNGLQKIIAKKYEIEKRTRLRAEIINQNHPTSTLEALNEISIGGINRTVHLNATVVTPQKSIETEITGDGLIVSTRTGSTAYNINAGGPILLTEALSIVANNAFFQSDALLSITKSLVVPSETLIKVTDLSHNAANLPYVIADGQKSIKISKGDRISIRKAKNKNYFMKF